MCHKPLPGASPLEVARYLNEKDRGSVVFFDSGKSADGKSLWSIVTCRPRAVLTEQNDCFVELPSGRQVADIHAWMTENNAVFVEDPSCNVPFQGGLAGFLGFELGWFLSQVNAERKPSNTPLLWVGAFDAAACYAHETGSWFLTGDQESDASRLLKEAIEHVNDSVLSSTKKSSLALDIKNGGGGVRLCVSSLEYKTQVTKCIQAIRADELSQVNFTERFESEWKNKDRGDAFALFEALRAYASGSYGGFICSDLLGEEFSVASISPEQFLAVEKRRVITRPIKGTRRRGVTAEEDEALGLELLASKKDRHENQLIVALMHQDLKKVCVPESLQTSAFCALESFEGVHHLVSTIEGELAPEYNALDVFLACFPAGSCVGSPRGRAMEIIATLESSARGPYTGSMFYWSKNGRLDSNVLIRTAVLSESRASYGAGGAVVMDSDPKHEYEEAKLKARPFFLTLNGGVGPE